MSWQDKALCKGKDTSLWFPDQGEVTSPIAKATCAICPVREQCAEHAITYPEHYGLWGNLSERKRRTARKGRAPQTVPCIWCGQQALRRRFNGIILDAWCHADACQREQNRRKNHKSRNGVAS